MKINTDKILTDKVYILKTALPRNGKTTRPLTSVKCSQKELFHAVES